VSICRKRHLLRKKSRSRRSSTSTQSTKPNKLRTSQKKRAGKSLAAKPSQPAPSSPRLALGKTVIADMLGDPSLSFTAAARKWGVDPRWLQKYFGSEFEKSSSGRIRAKVRNPRHKTLYKPTATPGMPVPVVTKSKRERLLLGEWMAALNEAGKGDWPGCGNSQRRSVSADRHRGGVCTSAQRIHIYPSNAARVGCGDRKVGSTPKLDPGGPK
jgi:hypothetical protein